MSPIDVNDLSHFGLLNETIEFLSIAGLPRSAAPCLDFVQNGLEGCGKIGTLLDHYPHVDLDSGYSRYIVIGGDGSGNPIALHARAGDLVVWLDHENRFQQHFMNSSLQQMAGCLLAYRAFVRDIIATNGDDAFMEYNFTDRQFTTLRSELARIDAVVVQDGLFWGCELRSLLGGREIERKSR